MSQRRIKYRKRIDRIVVTKEGDVEAMMRRLKESYLANVQKGMDSKVGPHMAEVARNRAPVGKTRSFNPKPKSFQAVELIDRVPAGRGAGPKIERLTALRAGETEVDLATDAGFFVGRRGTRNAGKTPDVIAFRRGGVVGAFAHKAGTLRDSIVYEGSRIEGDSVIGVVRARAPYAMARHEGFYQRAGSPPNQTRGRKIPGVPFLRQAFANVKEELKNPATYKG